MSEIEKIHVPSGFWRRLLARLIDFFIIAIFSNLFLYFSIFKTNNNWEFKQTYLFYVWSIFTAILVFFVFVGIPLITRGWSIGYKLMKIKVISTKGSIYKAIINRELLYGISWTCIIILVIIIINHTLIFQLAKRSQDPKAVSKLTALQQIRISVIIMLSSVMLFLQAFSAISIIPNKNKLGIHDRIASTMVIRREKEADKKEKIIEIIPTKINNVKVEWIKGTYG